MGIGRTQEESWTKAAPCAGHISMRRAHVIMLRPQTYEGTEVIATTVALHTKLSFHLRSLHPRTAHLVDWNLKFVDGSIVSAKGMDSLLNNDYLKLRERVHLSLKKTRDRKGARGSRGDTTCDFGMQISPKHFEGR